MTLFWAYRHIAITAFTHEYIGAMDQWA